MTKLLERIRLTLEEVDTAETHVEVHKTDLANFLDRLALLHTICESMPDGVFVKDLNGRVIMSNSAGPRNIGKSISDIIGKDASEIFSAETADQIRKEDRQVIESGRMTTYESTEGDRIYNTLKIPYRDRHGAVIGVLGITRDITDRKQAEDALRENEAQFRRLLEVAPDAIVGVDQAGRIVMVNEQAEQMFGYGREELLDQPVEMLMPDRYQTAHVQNRTGYTAHPRTRPMGADLDLYGLHKDGHEFPVEISLSPLETKDGVLITSIIRDITRRKEMEEQLRRHTIALEEKVLQSERLATVGRMAAQVAHEIRNPLSSIGLNIELLSDEIKDHPWQETEEANELIQITMSEIERLNNVIHDYLQFARMPSQNLQEVSINGLIDELVKFVHPELSQAGIKLECRLDPQLGSIDIDPAHMRQAVLNCIRNAMEAMPDGGVLSLTTALSDQQAELIIADSGTGIQTAHKENVFDPFYSTKDKGTGLGLPYVRQIVEEHGGQVDLSSESGKGTSVVIRLPATH